MVAYSFRQQFIEPILCGAKRQTIRKPRVGKSRHAQPGDELQLYTGMRTKQCRLIGRATCTSLSPIRIEVEDGRIELLDTGTAVTTQEDLDAFARLDSFDGWHSMWQFWRQNHPDTPVFSGVLIRWGGFLAR